MAAAVALGTLGCNSTDSPNVIEVEPGTYEFTPGNGSNYFVDASFGGLATEVRVARQYYGRLVSIASCTPEGGIIDVVHTDFVIDPREADTWSAPFSLSTNPVDGSQTLCIAEDVNDTTVDQFSGTSPRQRFLNALIEAAGGVRPVTDLGFIGVGNYTMVPRNAAFVLQFDDLIDPSTLNSDSIRIVQGNPAIIPFPARIFPDPNFGGLADFDGNPGSELYPTRIIVDPSVSAAESLATGLSANLTGFPSSLSATLANVQVRVATRRPNGQVNPILQNPSEHPVVTNGNGTFDFGGASRDVVRAFRSGGQESVTGDPFSGFLPDASAPQIIGAQGAVLQGPFQPDAEDPLVFRVPSVSFNSQPCGQEPIEGDVIITSSNISVLVLRNDPGSSDLRSGSYNAASAVATNVRVRVLTPIPAQFGDDAGAAFQGNGAGAAQYTNAYDPRTVGDGGDLERPQCFISVTPTATQFPVQPNVGVATESVFTVRFSEPMNGEVMEPYESIRLTRHRPIPEENADYLAGTLRGNLGLTEFTFSPAVELEHTNGNTELFHFSFGGGDLTPSDLAGNNVADLLQSVVFSVSPDAGTMQTGSRVSLFNSFDDELPKADLGSDDLTERIPRVEWAGQANINSLEGRIRPRPVVREQIFVSAANPLPGAMTPGLGTTLPLNPRGARTQFIWRYVDFGIPLYGDGNYRNGLDVNRLNVDIEAAYLSPLGSNPVFESYSDFTMNMAHSAFLPDEVIDPMTGALINPTSGLVGTYSGNLLDAIEDPLQEVHPRERGYTINPGDQTLTSDGLTTLIPLPMNQGTPDAEKLFYTWRDTAIMTLGGSTTAFGAPPIRVLQIEQEYPRDPFIGMMGPICTQPGDPNPIYTTGFIRTAALPILMDFRCFNSGTASTGNRFDHGLAHATTAPFFRAFSAGGTNQAGAIDIIDPDSETMANGGYDPTSTPPGAETGGLDNVVYAGALDLVVRVSRVTSVFFPAIDPSSFADGANDTDYVNTYSTPHFVEPVLFPTALQQPQGTAIELAYRASNSILAGSPERDLGQKMDPYGDFFRNLPENYGGGDMDGDIPGVAVQGNASCFDASFSYDFIDMMGNNEINNNVSFVGGNANWRTSVDQLDNARFFQIRLSFISNVATGEAPSLSSIGMGWNNN